MIYSVKVTFSIDRSTGQWLTVVSETGRLFGIPIWSKQRPLGRPSGT